MPILQLRPMHGHRERYFLLLRDQSPLRVRPPAARRLSTPILSGSEAIDRTRRAGNAGADCGHEGIEPGRTAVSGRWHAFTSNWRELTSHWPRIARPRSANVFCSGLFCYARSKERKPNLNYQFSHDEVTLLRLALGIALRQFEDCLDGEAPQMLTYINQPSWSEASQAARAMIEQISIPGVVVTISAQARSRN